MNAVVLWCRTKLLDNNTGKYKQWAKDLEKKAFTITQYTVHQQIWGTVWVCVSCNRGATGVSTKWKVRDNFRKKKTHKMSGVREPREGPAMGLQDRAQSLGLYLTHYIWPSNWMQLHPKPGKGKRLMNTQQSKINSKWNACHPGVYAYGKAAHVVWRGFVAAVVLNTQHVHFMLCVLTWHMGLLTHTETHFLLL